MIYLLDLIVGLDNVVPTVSMRVDALEDDYYFHPNLVTKPGHIIRLELKHRRIFKVFAWA